MLAGTWMGGRCTLAVKNVAAYAFADRHAQIDVQANARDADAGVVAVRGREVGRVMIVAVVMAGVAARMLPRGQGHGGLRRENDDGSTCAERRREPS